MDNKASVKPDVYYIDDIVFDISNGRFCVPAFQRGYVWEKRDIIDLFDSIYNGYPIGSILLWDTNVSIERIESFNGVTSRKDKSLYILDGQQRLTTLFNCLSGEAPIDDKWIVYIDLRNESFVHLKKNERPKPEYFPVAKIIKTSDFLKESKSLWDRTENISYVETAEKLANTIRKYRVSIIHLNGGDVDSAVEIFTRINRTGREIHSIDIIRALSYNKNGKIFDQFRLKVESVLQFYSFVDLEDDKNISSDILMKLIRVSSGFEFYSTNDSEKFAQLVNDDSFNVLVYKIIEVLDYSLNFMKNDLKFSSFNELPLSIVFYCIFSYFIPDSRRINSSDKFRVERMVYIGAISEIFSTSPSNIDKIIRFFNEDFDVDILTKKMKESLNVDSVSKTLKNICASSFKAQSSLSKTIYNIIKRDIASSGIEQFCFPPQNLFSDKKFTDKLGNKIVSIHEDLLIGEPDFVISRRQELYNDIVLKKFNALL